MAAVQTLPKDVSKLGSEIKLFGKWDTQECVLCLRCCFAHGMLMNFGFYLAGFGFVLVTMEWVSVE